ncbi:kinase-like domain-containing protein, partial [Hyaloscypha finlandica]
ANSPQAAREREVYRQISSITTLHAGSKCVRMLLDLFDITTATGNHICMVYRPLGLRISDFQALIPGGKLSQVILKLTLKHVLLALEFLHSVCHLAHTDIQAKNILMDIDDENVLTEFEEAEVRDPSPCKVGRDRIIYTSRQMRSNWRWKVHRGYPTILYRAPEVILRKPWDKKVDIWNLGVLLWDLSQNKHLFDARDRLTD